MSELVGSGRALLDRLAVLPATRWFSYGAVLLVQLRAMWGIWNRDLSGGDTASYFFMADLWSDGLGVNLAWSPLYTAFLGTFDWALTDAVTAVRVHRVVIVVALALLLLALLRRLLPPWAALVVCCWWASLPVIYDSVFEVHLFAAFPLITGALLLTNEPSLRRKGAVIGLLLAFAVVVRNEAGFVALLLLLAIGADELRARRAGAGVPLPRLAAAFGLPVLAALAVLGITYAQSDIKGDQLELALDQKHTRNMCQVIAFNHQQREPADFPGNPFTECQDLTGTLFDDPEPSLVEAWRDNPSEMLAVTTWNVRLLPQGLQLALFNGAAGDSNPDYVNQPLGKIWAAGAALLVVALLVAGAVVIRRDWGRWRPLLYRQRWAWIALAAIAVVVLAVVVFTQRPRPAYMFGLTAGMLALIGLAAAVLARRFRIERLAAVGAAILPLLLIVALPVRFHEGPTPLADAFDRLDPVIEREPPEGSSPTVLAAARQPHTYCYYLRPNESCSPVTLTRDLLLSDRLPAELDRLGVTEVYIDELVAGQPGAAALLAGEGGWRAVRSGAGPRGRWAVLQPESAPAED